jgi:hypothetical protein
VAAPAYFPPTTAPAGGMSPEAMRYRGRGAGGGRLDPRAMMPPRPTYTPPSPVAPVPAPASKGGLPVALDEKQLKITLMLNAVKLISPK